MAIERRSRMEGIDPKVIKWDPELNTYKPEHGYDDLVDVFQLPDGTYEGAAGKKVCDEAMNSGRPLVQCLVRQGTHENVVRANLRTAGRRYGANPLSVVEVVGHAYSVAGFSIQEIMDYTMMSQSRVEDRLMIYEASPLVKRALGKETIGIGQAVLLAGIENREYQEELFRRVGTYGWTVKKLAEQLRGGDDDENQEASLMALDQQFGVRAGKAEQCRVCGAEEDETAQIQTVTVCGHCLHTLKRIGLDPPGERWVAVAVALLREARAILAGFQAGALFAEQIDRFLENDHPTPNIH